METDLAAGLVAGLVTGLAAGLGAGAAGVGFVEGSLMFFRYYLY